MSGFVEDGLILENTNIGKDVWRMVVQAPKQAEMAKIGQFANVRVTKGVAPLLRRPISYAGFDAEKGTVEMLYRVVGNGTELMAQMKVGETVDILGPLGNQFHPSKRMLLIGGGVGIAPMLCMARKLEPGQEAVVILGFRDASEAFWAELFAPYPVKVFVTTDDGSKGIKGYPTTIMEEVAKEYQVESIHTCGPTPMMRGVSKEAERLGISCEVSLEEHMGCGTGGCVCCAVQGKSGKRYKVCLNGPVFPGEEVFF